MTPTTAEKKETNRRINVGSAAVLLIGMSLVGQVLGFLRTKLVNGNFPAVGPHSTDAYFAAFSIPDFFFFTLAAGALGVAFMPALSDHLHKNDRKGVWELATWLLNMLAVIMTAVGVIMFVFAGPLIHHVVAPSLQGEQFNTAVTIMRLIAFNPLLFTISGIITSVQQTLGRFFFYAIAPLFYNLSIIVSIYAFKHNIGLVGLGIGAAVGAVLQLIVVFIGNYKLNFHYRPRINWKSHEFKSILANLPARSIDQGIDQVNSVVETHIASSLSQGSITYYNNAYVLSTAPILLIGTAISTAAFPRLNQHLSQGRPDLFRKDFLKILRVMIWLSAPLVVVCFFARGYLARLIFTQGNGQIAAIFGFLTAAIFFRILYSIMSRWFYAQRDTRTPLLVSVFTIGLNIFLAYHLARRTSYDVEGLALAQSLVATIEVLVLGTIMLYRDSKLFDREFVSGIWRIVSVTGFSVVAGFTAVTLYPLNLNDKGFLVLGSKLTAIAVAVLGTHILISALFDLDEVRPLFKRLKGFVFKSVRID
ncbi:MAG: murein biosynthesis integral membrane protein MurJ [Patescibacteria group bacterium]|nr:murein biosynthesis integral membrane protein MurJ [Patescibacteria group bacterium]